MSQPCIQKILIANRGEIARRIIRTCRAMGIATVAVCSDADRDAPFVREADEVVTLGGLQAADSYLVGDAILAAAGKTGADAIHPGYGFLSENAEFAKACEVAGITFIGPPSNVIAAMGSKIEAKRRMQAADMPLLPTIEVRDQSAESVLKQVAPLGWPVLIKASAGGGGRGMRIVRGPEGFADMLAAAKQESQAAFGDGTLFVEPYIENARHIEVQVFGDSHGNVVHLFERECSIQRRHQKIIEESPSVVLDEALRSAMTAAAVRGAKAIDYVNAGTFEFLLTPERKFYFLEVNTRLQVEHPVTELTTELDLVRLQILVAAGEPLPPEVFEVQPRGHAIEARLCAEDPREDYRPAAGTLHRFEIPTASGVRVDAAIGSTASDGAAVVPPYYDSMLAKVIVHAPTRAEAARRLARALAAAKIHGLRTNRELLVRVLEHPDFLSGATDTHFLERHDAAKLAAPLVEAKRERLHAAAAALAGQAENRATAAVLANAPSGWRNNPSQLQRVSFQSDGGEWLVEYAFERAGLTLRVNGELLPHARCQTLTPTEVRLEVDGIEHTYHVDHQDDTFYVDSPFGASVLVEVPRFPLPQDAAVAGSLVAPLPGVVQQVKVHVGDVVSAGDLLLVIDSMKMLHEITAPAGGTVTEVHVEAGSQVDAGAVLVVIDDTASAAAP
jgi:acetyl/propionyl-CoA carboxylase alpha subunit